MNDCIVAVIDRALPERLTALQRASGLPVVFGGSTRATPTGQQLAITRLVGTLGKSLHGLHVTPGHGMGGLVMRDGMARRVNDYAAADKITHHYDTIVVRDERITSVMAVPVTVRGKVRGILYGAVRCGAPIGDRAMRAADAVAAQLQRDLERLLTGFEDVPPHLATGPLDELAAIVGLTEDDALRVRLRRVYEQLSGHALGVTPAQSVVVCPLSPREVEILRLVETGARNVEIAAELRLSPETVKAYLRSAMRKLGASNRTAAVHAARLAGSLNWSA